MRRVLPAIVICCAGALAVRAEAANRHLSESGGAAKLPYSAAVVSGDYIYVTGNTGATGGQLGADIGAQTAQALDNIAATLKKAGATLSDVVATQVYLTDAANAPGMEQAYGSRFMNNPPTRVVVVTPSLVGGKALIEINAVAVRHGVSHRAIVPRGWQKPSGPISYAQKVGNTLFISALSATTPGGDAAPPANAGAQVKTIMDQMGTLLRAAGMDYGDIAGGRVWIGDMKNYPNVNAVYRSYFAGGFPARATLGFGLVNRDDLVEISAVAVKGGSRRTIAGAINDDGSQATPNPNYSAGVRVGNHMWITGMTGETAANKGDVGSQTTQTLTQMLRVLKAGGFTPAQVVEVNVYLQDLHDAKQYQQMNAAYREVFPKDFPARTTVQAANANNALIEIVMQAAR